MSKKTEVRVAKDPGAKQGLKPKSVDYKDHAISNIPHSV